MASPYGSNVATGIEYANHTTDGSSSKLVEPRTPAVADQIGLLQKNVNILHELISKVESRIDAVLRPAGTSGDKAGGGTPVLAPLAGAIADQNLALTQAHARLYSLIERVEL